MAAALVIAFSQVPLGSAAVSERDLASEPARALESESRMGTARVGSRSETCRHARNAIGWYHGRANTHRSKRRAARLKLAYPIRKPGCARARWRAERWRKRALQERRSTERWHKRKLVGEAAIRAYINDDCLEEIIDRESAGTWNPTIYNYAGSGAYGLPQALPGWKMASAGPDWRTNPKTQIRWMRSYVNARYGGSCGALAHHNANGWY